MAQYHIKFIGHIIEEFRPEGFPKQVTFDLFVDVANTEFLKKVTNDTFNQIRHTGGMVIVKPGTIPTPHFQPDKQFFVPMHMISWLETETKILASPIPDFESLSPEGIQ